MAPGLEVTVAPGAAHHWSRGVDPSGAYGGMLACVLREHAIGTTGRVEFGRDDTGPPAPGMRHGGSIFCRDQVPDEAGFAGATVVREDDGRPRLRARTATTDHGSDDGHTWGKTVPGGAMRPLLIVLIGALLLLSGCTGVTPASRATPRDRAADRASEDDAAPFGYRVVLHGVLDPLEDAAGAEIGTRLLALDVTVAAIGGTVTYRAEYGTLILADGTVATGRPSGPEPVLAGGTLVAGASARGWLTFAIYADAAPVLFTYTIPPAGGGGGAGRFRLDDR